MQIACAVKWAWVVPVLAMLGCAAEDADELDSQGSGELDDGVMSDEGLDSSADALSGGVAAGSQATTTANLNLRSGPGTGYGVIKVLSRGSSVTVITGKPENGFYNVQAGASRGWVHGAYLSGSSSSSGSSSTPTSGSNRRVSTTMLYLGSCQYLGTCDSYSRAAWNASPGTVVLGCGGKQSCSNDDPFISVPRGGPACGTSVRICRVSDPSRCVTAKVKERSDSNQRYEASVAVAEGLGWTPHDRYYESTGRESKCGSSMGGDARVTISW